MRGQALVTIWAEDIDVLLPFYCGLLGLQVSVRKDGYVELEGAGIRLAICVRTLAGRIGARPGDRTPGEMQSIELTFPLRCYEEVDAVYADLVAKGAISVQAPVTLTGGQRVAYLGDPEGNTHALVSEWPRAAECYW